MSRLAPRRRGRRVPGLEPAWRVELDEYVTALAWSHDGLRLAAAPVVGPITMWDAVAGHVSGTLAGHASGTLALAWHPRSALLASAGQDGRARLWQDGQAEIATLDGGAAWVERLAWNPDGDVLATAAGRLLRLWSPSGSALGEYRDHPSTIADLKWRPGGRDLAAAVYGGVVVRDIDRPDVPRRYEWKGSSLALAWSPNGRYIATGEQDLTVHFWNVADGTDLQMWGYENKALQLAWNHSGRYLATGGSPHIVIWDCSGKGPAGSKPQMLRLHQQPISALAYQPAGPKLLSGGRDGRVVLWEPDKIKGLPLAALLDAPISAVTWAPDGRRFAAATEAGAVTVFDVP